MGRLSTPTGCPRLLPHHAVERLRVVDNERTGRNLGHELVRAGERHADPLFGTEQLEKLRLVGGVEQATP